jgi:hypothetical protein
MTTPPLPEQIELHRDRMWRRDEDLRIESAVDAERFIEDVGFANTLTDARRAGPSLYIAVCGRRDVSLPRNVQKDEETRLTWYLKDEVMRRGRVYYAKLAGGRSMFVAPRLISHFAAIWMPRRKEEPQLLSDAAQRVLKVLRREHELATGDLRAESRVTERCHHSIRGMRSVPPASAGGSNTQFSAVLLIHPLTRVVLTPSLT